MIINGTRIEGLFLYKEGMTYEAKDLIYYNGNLYKVVSTYKGEVPPDQTPSCVPYVKSLGDNNILTASEVPSILSEYISGIGLGGVVANLGQIDWVDLDKYVSTSVYSFRVGITNYLLRVYKLSNQVIQEVIDYVTPVLMYRIYNDGNWTAFNYIKNYENSDSTAEDEFVNDIHKLNSEAAELYRKSTKIFESAKQLVNLKLIESNGYYCISENPTESIEGLIQVILTYRKSGSVYQDYAVIDIGSKFEDNLINTFSESGISLKFQLWVEDGIKGIRLITYNSNDSITDLMVSSIILNKLFNYE